MLLVVVHMCFRLDVCESLSQGGRRVWLVLEVVTSPDSSTHQFDSCCQYHATLTQ